MSASVPFVDVPRSYTEIQPALDEALREIFADGAFVQGAWVARFEEAFARYLQTDHAIAVSSGTEALRLTLQALGAGRGDEILTTPFTFVATAEAICATGATPVFVDVDPVTLQLDVGAVEEAITERTVGILPVHLYGGPVELGPLLVLALERDLWILEDACQAHGARYFGRRAGSFGAAGCFSFYPGKNLGTCGEGGLVVTSEPDLADRVRRLRDHGSVEKYEHVELGTNARMSEIEAAVLALKLPHLDGWNEQRRALAARYAEQLEGLPLRLPRIVDGGESVHHLFVVRSEERDALREHLGAGGVQTGLHYPTPLHRQPVLQGRIPAGLSFPHAERAARTVLSLPMFPELTEHQVDRVCTLVAEHFGARV